MPDDDTAISVRKDRTVTTDLGIAEGICQSLSCPSRASDDGLLEVVAQQNFAAVSELVIKRYGELLDSSGDGIVPALREVKAGAEVDFETAWSPGVGPMVRGIQNADFQSVRFGVAQALLHGYSRGYLVPFRMQFERPYRLLASGALLPPADAIDVTVTGDEPVARLSLADHVRTIALGGVVSDVTPENSGIESLPAIRIGNAELLLPPAGALEGQTPENIGPVASPEAAAEVERSLELLARVSPPYYGWVAKVMRRLAVVPSRDKGVGSGTVKGDCGASYITSGAKPVVVGEMLIHESSHQYFNLATGLGPVADPDFLEEFYSPFPRKMRRLDRLLLAYHAFANVLIYYDDCLRQGAATARQLGQDQLADDVRHTEAILDQHRGHLTALGKDFFAPLFESGAQLWRA
jgi:HEXXH motif-containing protein